MAGVPAVAKPTSLLGKVVGVVLDHVKTAVGVTDLSAFAGGGRGGGWFSIIREPFKGAWQRNQERAAITVAAHYAVYSCVSLIASDISKMCVRLVEQDQYGIWNPVQSNSFSPVLRRPNKNLNRIKFIEQWVISKLLHGNTYILKQRDARGVVTQLHILNPRLVKPLITPNGDVYYEVSPDYMLGNLVTVAIRVPQSEIIHDVMVPLEHPLCGVSPLIACGLAAVQGLEMQGEATRFFRNGSMPGGIVTLPDETTDKEADAFKAEWEKNYSGENAGRVAVLGGGVKFERMQMTSLEAQLIEQLNWNAITICSCFHVPAYMVGVGDPPAYNNVEALNQQYYSQCLQALIEQIELCLDEGLGLTDVIGHDYGTEFDLDGLLRMDTATQYKTYGDAVKSGLMKPDEGRAKIGLSPVEGGDQCYLQQQNFSLAALAKRDAQDDPFKAYAANTSTPATPPTAANDDQAEEAAADKALSTWIARDFFNQHGIAA